MTKGALYLLINPEGISFLLSDSFRTMLVRSFCNTYIPSLDASCRELYVFSFFFFLFFLFFFSTRQRNIFFHLSANDHYVATDVPQRNAKALAYNYYPKLWIARCVRYIAHGRLCFASWLTEIKPIEMQRDSQFPPTAVCIVPSVCARFTVLQRRGAKYQDRSKARFFLFPIAGDANENKATEENSDLPVQAWKIQEQGLPFAELKIPKAYNYVGKKPPGQFGCSRCGRSYMRKDSLQRHVHWECGKEPQFQCPFCPQRCKRKAHWLRHIRRQHLDKIGDMEAYLLAYTPKLEID